MMARKNAVAEANGDIHNHNHQHQMVALNGSSSSSSATSAGAGSSGTTRHSMEITLVSSGGQQSQRQHILLHSKDLMPPTAWTKGCRQLRCLYSRLCYSLCLGCCCCCPDSVLPDPPPSNVKNQCSPLCNRGRWPAWVILTLVWGISFVLACPHAWYTKLSVYNVYDQYTMTRCTINAFPSPSVGLALSWYTLATQYATPIGLTSFFYLHIGFFLWRRESIGTLTEGRRLFLLRRKRRRVLMLMYVVLVFAVCWLPLTLYILLTDYGIITHNQSKCWCVCWRDVHSQKCSQNTKI